MIITDEFVFINFPKTGSTFVRKALRAVNEARMKDPVNRSLYRIRAKKPPFFQMLTVPNRIAEHDRQGGPTPHGTVAQIPDEHAHKALLSVVRDPFERLISGYHFGDWKRVQNSRREHIERSFPHFPELRFEEYIRFSYELEMKAKFGCVPDNLGPISASFLQFFTDHPSLKSYRERFEGKGRVDLEALKNEIKVVHFLRTESLRAGLMSFLLEQGWPEKHVQKVQKQDKVNVSKGRKDRSAYFSRDLVRYIEEKEALFFELFPEYAADGSVEGERTSFGSVKA